MPFGVRDRELSPTNSSRRPSGGRSAKSSVAVDGRGVLVGDDLCNRLSRKIRLQATQLADTTERLQQQEAYTRLVETRLLEIQPCHSLPVSPCQLVGSAENGSIRQQRSSNGCIGGGVGVRGGVAVSGRCWEEQEIQPPGHETAQERLKDAAQLIRQLREALATRDADAKTAADRARKFQREANDLRRKIAPNDGNTNGKAGTDVKAHAVAAGEGRDHLRREVSRLKKGLQGQREACAVARAESAKLQAALDIRSNDLGIGKGGGGILAELALARSNARDLRDDVARLRRQIPTSKADPEANSGSLQRTGSSCRSNASLGGEAATHSTSVSGTSTSCGKRGDGKGAGPQRVEGGVGRGRGEGREGGVVEEGEMSALEAEKEALVDYVQELLDRMKGLEAACGGLERERSEAIRLAEGLKERLKAADDTATAIRQENQQKQSDNAQVGMQLLELQQAGKVERAEKEEMERLYTELMKQLRTAEEEKGDLQSRAQQAGKREEAGAEAIGALREQLDQCLRRLAVAEDDAADNMRLAEEEILALKTALYNGNARLARLDELEAKVIARAEELKACREGGRSCEAELTRSKDRVQHLIGALEGLETQAAVSKSGEGKAVTKNEELERERSRQETKVAELSFLCEELQKRLLSLQSGEEVERVQREVREAFGLAERQDELLEEASTKLELVKDESRILREELRRNEECSRNARNVLRPVLANAWSNFFIAGDVPRKATSTHLWEGDGVECRRRDDLCWEEEEDGEEVSLEDVARATAEVLSNLLARFEDGIAETGTKAWAEAQACSAAGRARTSPCGAAAGVTGAFHTSNLTSSSGTEDLRIGEAYRRAGVSPAERFLRNDPGRKGTTFGGEQSRRLQGVRWEEVDGGVGKGGSGGRAGSIAREGGGGSRFVGGGVCIGGSGGSGGASAKRHGGWKENNSTRGDEGATTVEMVDTGAYCCSSRGLRRKNGEHGGGGSSSRGTAAARVALPNPESIQRMENIRRGIGGDAALDVGVKANRRGYLQGGRSRETTGDNCWTLKGSQSPGTTKIRQRVREAQATLRSLRSTTD